MNAPFQLTPQAIDDLNTIWCFIAKDNREAAGRVMGIRRQDITPLAVRFWTLTKFPNYVIVYRPETAPLQVIAVLHGKQNLKEVLRNRTP